MTTRPHDRGGFTLLELILASVIAALLLSALYVAMDVQLRLAQAGREKIEQGTLARALLTRIAQDVSGCLTPIRATKAATAAVSSATGDASAASSGAVTPFNAGVEGDASVLILYVSRVPPKANASNDGDVPLYGVADTRRISYWLVADGGLARQEFERVSGDDEASQPPPNLADEPKYVIAPEVVGLAFRYFDGTSWTDSWSGSTLGSDELTPIGPPRAVEITLTIRLSGSDAGGDDNRKTFRHVVAIGAANAQPAQTADTSPTTGATP